RGVPRRGGGGRATAAPASPATAASTAATTHRRPGQRLADQGEGCLRSSVSMGSRRRTEAAAPAGSVSASDEAGALEGRAATKAPPLRKRAVGALARAPPKTSAGGPGRPGFQLDGGGGSVLTTL